jgi:hypothetical protein
MAGTSPAVTIRVRYCNRAGNPTVFCERLGPGGETQKAVVNRKIAEQG